MTWKHTFCLFKSNLYNNCMMYISKSVERKLKILSIVYGPSIFIPFFLQNGSLPVAVTHKKPLCPVKLSTIVCVHLLYVCECIWVCVSLCTKKHNGRIVSSRTPSWLEGCSESVSDRRWPRMEAALLLSDLQATAPVCLPVWKTNKTLQWKNLKSID